MVKRIVSVVIVFLRFLFNFRKPRFNSLQLVDVVVDRKVLFLVSWEFSDALTLRIRPGKFRYRSPSMAAVCQLPDAADTVEIVLSNLWRRQKLLVPLKRVELAGDFLKYLGQQYHKTIRVSTDINEGQISIPYFFVEHISSRIHINPAIQNIAFTLNQHQLDFYVT